MASDTAFSARLYILGAAFLFSTGGVAIKGADLTPIQVSGLRSAIAALALLLLLPAARRAWSWQACAVGAAYAATFTLFVLATRYTTAAHAVFLQAMAPAYVLAISPWLLKESIGKRDLWFIGAIAAGMALLIGGTESGLSTAPRPWLGNGLAVAAGMTYAAALVGMRWLARSGREGQVECSAVAGNFFAFVVAMPFIWPMSITLPAAGSILYLGLFQVAFAYVLVMRGLKNVRAVEASLLLLLEPVLNPVWVWWLIGEHPGGLALAGCGVILVAMAFYAVRTAEPPEKASPG